MDGTVSWEKVLLYAIIETAVIDGINGDKEARGWVKKRGVRMLESIYEPDEVEWIIKCIHDMHIANRKAGHRIRRMYFTVLDKLHKETLVNELEQ